MRSRRPAPRHFSGLISTLLCCLLVATPAASALQGGNGQRGTRSPENPPTKGAPGQNLPNLDEVRRRGPSDPKALPPVPSRLKKCPPDEPNCNAPAHAPRSGRADAGGTTSTRSLTYSILGALTASLNNPYAGVLLASSGSGIPEPPPSRGKGTPTHPARGWLSSVKGFFGVTVQTPTPGGELEPGTCEYISGWAWDPAQPTTPVMVALFDGEHLVASVRADRYRADLVARGIGDGRHGFRIAVPDSLRDANAHTIGVKILGAGTGSDPDLPLANSPKVLGPCGAPSYGGDITSASCDVITGRAWDAGRPSTPIEVDVYVREGGVDVFRARVAADVYDAGIGVGDNRHLFRLPTPAVARDGQPHVITARPAGKDASHNFASQPAVACAAPVFEGQFNAAACDYLTGWAWDSTRPDAPVSVEVVENGRVVAAALADTLRPDIPTADGRRHGFRIPWPDTLRDGLSHTFSLRVSGTDSLLGGLTSQVCPAQSGTCGPDRDLPTTEFVKDFYMGALGRQPRPVELQHWSDALRTAAGQGPQQAVAEARRLGRELFLQAEYAGRGRMTSDKVGDYVSDLYWGYLQRGPDAAGHAHWTNTIPAEGQAGWLNALSAFESSAEFSARVATLCPTPAESVRDYDAVSDFSPLQNPNGAWTYGYRVPGGAFTAYANRANKWGAGTDTWARDTNGLFVTRNNTGATYTYPAPSVVHPAGVLNLHPGPNGEKSVVRWTAAAAGTYVIAGYFKGIDTVGTTTDVAVTHNGASLFGGSVNSYGQTASFSVSKEVTAGQTIEFSVGVGHNGNYSHDSTGLSATISLSPPAQTQPYNEAAAQVSGRLEAELFDEGGEGVAYHDASPLSQGQDFSQPPPFPVPPFRLPTDVDINKAANYSNGYVVRMQAGDWLNYTVDVARPGSYTLSARTYYWGAAGGTFHVEANGADVTGPVQPPGGSAWMTVSKAGVQLNAGRHVLRVVCDANGSDGASLGELDYLSLTPDADAGLVGHWKFDENAGLIATDSSGGGNFGSLQNGASWAVAKAGTAALSFDGADDYVQMGVRPGLAVTTAATFGAWLYPTGAGSGGSLGGIVVNKEGEYEIARFPDGTVRWAFANANPGWNWVDTGFVVPLNRWTHVAVTYEAGAVKTYADGRLVHTHAGSGAIGDALPSQNDFRVGGRQFMSQHFQGRLDDVRVYNRALSGAEVEALVAAAPADPTGNDFSEAKKDPANETGSGGDDPLSRNFNFSIPLVELKGRAGLDLSLGLSYNSLVWTRDAATGAVKFDADYGDPSPGFRLGLPIIHRKHRNGRNENAYMLVTPSGGRVELRQVGSSNTYEATDSSYLQLTEDNGLTLRPTDGSQVSFALKGYEYKPTRIKDRNGNFISVSYNSAGNVSAITDTLGRAVTFAYDANGRPLSIGQNRDGQVHQWATFGYADVTMGALFADPSKVTGPANGTTISVLNRVSLQDGSFYSFLYNGWGQVYRAERRANDGSPAGRLLSYTEYDLQTPTAAQTRPPGAQGGDWTDCPRFTQRKDFVKDWNGDVPAVTDYGVEGGARTVVTRNGVLPGGTTPEYVKQKIYYEPAGTWRHGLVAKVETYSTRRDGQNADPHVYDLRRSALTTWAQDDETLAYRLNPRVKKSEVLDPQNNHTGTSYEYTSYGLAVEAKQWSGTESNVLRRTHTEYNLGPAYVSRRVIGLVSSVSIYDGQGHVASKVDYTYDQGGEFLQHQGEPVQHDGTNYDASFVVGRGLLTGVRRWDVTALHDVTKSVESRAGYNTTGSPVFSRDPAGRQATTSYADRFPDKTGTNTLAYPTTVTDPGGYSSKVEYSFDTGLVTGAEDPKGARQTFTYDAAGRVSRAERSGRDAATNQVVSGGYTRWVYADAMDAVQSWTKVDAGKPEVCSISVTDGAGRVRASASDFPGSRGGYRAQATVYDVAGRAWKQSNPAEVNGLWNPSGEDAAGWNWTISTYDWKGRPLLVTNPGSPATTREFLYGGCGCAGGEVVTTRDEVGRRQKITYDPLGRVKKTQVLGIQAKSAELSAGGDADVDSTTTNTYNALDKVTEVTRQAGVSGAARTATMSYDGHGRLKTRHLPAQDAGKFTAYTYNPDDTAETVTDARGAKTTFGYDARGLVRSVSYDAGQTGAAAAPLVTFDYDAAGNRTGMTERVVSANGVDLTVVGTTSYNYDALSRLTSEERRSAGLTGALRLSYSYNLAGQLTFVRDPWDAEVSYKYDLAGQLARVEGSGQGSAAVYVKDFEYRAWGATKAMRYGNDVRLDLTYTARLQPGNFKLTSPNPTTPTLLDIDYGYSSDGFLRSSTDKLNQAVDRAYAYDFAGRLTGAFSGSEAREWVRTEGASTGTVIDGPYRQTYTFDRWGGMREMFARSFTGSYQRQQTVLYPQSDLTGRHDYWTYDADGRVTVADGVGSGYDAAGRLRGTWNTSAGTSAEFAYDGDGRAARREAAAGDSVQTVYYLRSSVLGEVVAEATPAGARRVGFVHAGGELLATQSEGGVYYQHEDAAGLSKRTTDSVGALMGKDETDPRGVSVERPNSQQPLFRSGTGGGDRLVGGDERPFNPASLMDARTCDFGQMLVPCALKASFEEHINGARETNPELGLFWETGLWVGAADSAFYLLVFELDPEGLIEALNEESGAAMPLGFLPRPDKPRQPRRPRGRGTPRDSDWQSRAQLPQNPLPPHPHGAEGNLPFNSCAEFVDFLVAEAVFSLADHTFGMKGDSKAKVTGVHMMDLAIFGYDRHINNRFEGFKDNLVSGGQGAGVYGHILGQGGAKLGGIASMTVATFGHAIDIAERVFGKDQGPAETAGNRAGWKVGRHMHNFLTGKTPQEANSLRNSLMSELCK